jgi:hypothetical protein
MRLDIPARKRVTHDMLNRSARWIAVIAAGWMLAGCSVFNGNGNGNGGDPVDSFTPRTDDEAKALARIQDLISQAEALRSSPGLSTIDRAKLDAAVASARKALKNFMAKRNQGGTRRESMAGITAASSVLLWDNTTVVGTADDWLLVGCGLAAVAIVIFTTAPASRSALQQAWQDVGTRLDELGDTISSINSVPASACPQPRAADPTDPDHPTAPPASRSSDEQPTVDIAPVPRIDEPDERPDRCRPRPSCPHLGQDTVHHACADEVPPNRFPGCDALVNGKHFDAFGPDGSLWEVKTDNWSNYSEFLKQQTLRDHIATARSEYSIATGCGHPFIFAVADADLYVELTSALQPEGITVRHVPQCQRVKN